MSTEIVDLAAVKTATIIPFPNGSRAGLGTPGLELARLAVAIHLRALRKGLPSSYGVSLEACQRAANEIDQERLAAAQPARGD